MYNHLITPISPQKNHYPTWLDRIVIFEFQGTKSPKSTAYEISISNEVIKCA